MILNIQIPFQPCFMGGNGVGQPKMTAKKFMWIKVKNHPNRSLFNPVFSIIYKSGEILSIPGWIIRKFW